MHKQRANKKTQALTIPNLVIVQTKAFQYPPQHSLSISLRIAEHLDTWEAPSQILPNDAFIWT
jgi:hypothetical protein